MPAAGPGGDRRPGQRREVVAVTSGRQLGMSVVACLAGSGLAVYAVTRVWSVEITERPGLSPLRATTTGAAHVPWVIGLALVALAGAGALLATRGLVRRVLGGLLALVGAAVAIGMVTGRAGLHAGAAGAGATFWPIAGVVGGAIIVVAGLAAARHGHRWPAMGSRYDRSQAPPPAGDLAAGSRPSPSTGPAASGEPSPVDTRAAWDALDHGVDPTDR
jgi:uncharacterized membrane protein (TIGR02234 family)